MHLMETVLQHWTVDLPEQSLGDPDLEIGCHAEQVLVVGGVVDLAQGEAVVHCGDTTLVRVRNDVCRVEK